MMQLCCVPAETVGQGGPVASKPSVARKYIKLDTDTFMSLPCCSVLLSLHLMTLINVLYSFVSRFEKRAHFMQRPNFCF